MQGDRMSIAKTLLEGYRVLDLTDDKGLLASRILADMGAEVIKVEKPGGDEARRIGPFYKDQVDLEKSLFWFAMCMNKKSITLDITEKEGQEILKKLAQGADFLFESSSPGYMDGLGLGYQELSRLNRRLVYVSITPFGQSGPYRDFKGPDIVVWALSGFLQLCGDPGRPPVRFSFPQAYFMACGEAAIGAMLAHHYRVRTGEGQWVDTAAQHACSWPTMDARGMWEIFHKDQERAGGRRWRTMPGGTLEMHLLYPCRDGYVQLYIWGGKMGEASNKALQVWMEEEGLDISILEGTGWPLRDIDKITPEDYRKIVDLASRFVAQHTKEELYEGALKRGIMLALVSTIEDICHNRQLKERGFWAQVQHEELPDTIQYPGPWAKLTETPLDRWERAPRIGEHNNGIYLGELKMSPTEVEHLTRLGVI
jgi:crotonobetainyl-CoA:carnitine CoA-transferase CaiB-like acyl-CoA transferase